MQETRFVEELEVLVNRYSMEVGSNTPDFVLAQYIRQCLEAFDNSVRARDKWYGFWDRDEELPLKTKEIGRPSHNTRSPKRAKPRIGRA
jgi:hypothetical protein